MNKLLLCAGVLLSMVGYKVPEICAAGPQTVKPHVLVLNEGGGQHGPFTAVAMEWLRKEAAAKSFTVTEQRNADLITKEFLKDYALVIQLDFPPYTWDAQAQEAFIDYVDNGKGSWIGFHHATLLGDFDGYPMWQWFSDFMGGIKFQNYVAALADGTVNVEDSTHPVMDGVDVTFVLPDDEWYTYNRSPRGNVTVLASVDESTYSPATDIRMGDHPVIWTNTNKKAKNVYFQFGHSPKLFESENFIRLFSNAIDWCLSVDSSRSLDAEAAAKPVLSEKVLYSGDRVISFDTDPRGARAKGHSSDPDYAVYGHKSVYFDLGGSSIEDFNRLEFVIIPDCPGLRVVNLTVGFENDRTDGAGYNAPVGEHLVNLDNGKENKCYLEVADLRRDKMKGLRFTVTLRGTELPVKGESKIHIKKITAQRVPVTERISGWLPQADRIVYSMNGYSVGGKKTAIIDCDRLEKNNMFTLRDAVTGRNVLTGKVGIQKTTIGKYGVIDFSKFDRPGRYVLEAGGLVTDTFAIAGNSLWDGPCGKVLNFIYSMRCGYPVFGVHSMCHTDLMSVHNGVRRSYAGGWHDAGDLSQQTLQTADVTYALLELYEKKRDTDPDFAARLREEALWGLDFILRTRYGDGYRASSMGLLIWTDGVFGSHDDISTVRVQNVAFDNYLYAAYEAYAAKVLADDSALAAYLTQIAQEDYDFACAKFKESGFGGWISPYEHTYCTGESQHMASASWAASMLYELTGKREYAADAVEYARYVLDCQCCVPVGTEKLCGFFYRNPQKKSVVHFIHQSREQVFIQALEALCRTQPGHVDTAQWFAAIRNYGDYLKAIMKYTAPYGMLPSGIYHEDEPADSTAFFALHIFPPADAVDRFTAQRKEGVDVGEGYFVKRFPVWFNIYNGNLAVHTSMGKAAAICAKCLHDEELLDIAREQLYWIVGKNPFAQSLIYGEGHRYPELNNFSSGRIIGAMPVGIRSLDDSDEPYWPQFNCACYKEVWVTSAGKWLSLVAEI